MNQLRLMSVVLWVLFISSFTEAALPKEETCGTPAVAKSISLTRIVNGTEARMGEWPWQAMILEYQRSSGFFAQTCGGTLIYRQWVMSAAHCFIGQEALFTHVALGAHLKNLSDLTVKRVAVASIHCHNSFKGSSSFFADDICLLKLAAGISYTDYIQPACLPTTSADVCTGSACVITGWGDTKGTGTNNILREATVQIIDRATCNTWYQGDGVTLPEDHFCAGYPEGLVDTCQGDSGGPLVCSEMTADGVPYTLHGITSFGAGCALKHRPGVYTTVSRYLKWIDDTITFNSEKEKCYSDLPLECGSIVESDGTIIRSPIISTETWLYPKNSNCSWHIKAPEHKYILLRFECFFHVEPQGLLGCYDYMEITSPAAGVQKKKCGTFLPSPISINHNEATVSFYSDDTEQSSGFVMRVYFVQSPSRPIPGTISTTSLAGNTTSTANRAHGTFPAIVYAFIVILLFLEN